jgi:CubicO group peptidase (beta-lactamase class C family)
VALKLVEEGTLHLTDTLDTLLPEVAAKIPSASRITLEHLLAHRSGVPSPDWDDPMTSLDSWGLLPTVTAYTMEDRLREWVYGRPLDFEPGTAYRYSNMGYGLVGRIIEHAEGASLQSAMARVIFTPLGLTRTSIEALDDPSIARAYMRSGGVEWVDVSGWARSMTPPNGGFGSLVSTAEELATSFGALLAGHIVSPASVENMVTPRSHPEEYGLGIDVWSQPGGGSPALNHTGYVMGTGSFAFYFTQTRTLIVLLRVSGNTADLAASPMSLSEQLLFDLGK